MRLKPIIIAITILFTLIAVSYVSADEVTLAWDANIEENLAGYRVYRAEVQGTTSTAWMFVADTTETTYTDNVEATKSYIWYVTAYNTEGEESQASNVAVLRWPVAPPQNLRRQ